MKSKLKALLKLVLTPFILMWSRLIKNPKEFIFNLVIFCSAVGTIIGLGFLIPQTRLITKQLREINAQPLIKINFRLATSTIAFGQILSDPIDINLVAINKGNRVASYWRAALWFCKDINVIADSAMWNKEDKNQYSIESMKIIPPYFPGKLALYSDNLDSIGIFTLVAPTKNNSNLSEPIPIAMTTITGDYQNPAHYLVSLTLKGDFVYEELIGINGRMVKGYGSVIGKCFNININDNLLK